MGCCPSPASMHNCFQDEKACQRDIGGFAMRWLCAFAVRSNFYDRLCRVHLTDNRNNKIVRAFLIEEAKVVKRVIKSQQKEAEIVAHNAVPLLVIWLYACNLKRCILKKKEIQLQFEMGAPVRGISLIFPVLIKCHRYLQGVVGSRVIYCKSPKCFILVSFVCSAYTVNHPINLRCRLPGVQLWMTILTGPTRAQKLEVGRLDNWMSVRLPSTTDHERGNSGQFTSSAKRWTSDRIHQNQKKGERENSTT